MNHQEMETKLITKQWNSNQLKPQAPLGIFGILKESFKTITRNGKLLVSLTLLVFLLFSQVDIAKVFLLEPVLEDFSSQMEEHPQLLQDLRNNMHQTDYSGARKDIRDFVLVNLLTLTFYIIMSLVFFVATVSSSYEAYTAKVLGPKDLILKMKKSWKKPMLTNLYFIFILIGSALVCLFSIGIISILVQDSLAYMMYGFFLMAVLFCYFCALWMMSMVVSVLEDVGGLKAIVRAQELMKGNRLRTSLITVIVAAGYGVVHWTTTIVSSYNPDKWSQLAVSIPFTNGLLLVFKLIVFVVFTIFYHERKESSTEDKEVKELYFPIPAGDL